MSMRRDLGERARRPEGVHDLPAPGRAHEVNVLAVDRRADERCGDRAVHLLDLDLDAAVARVARATNALARRPDHPIRARLVELRAAVVERPLREAGVQRALHAGRVAVEPALE